MLLVWLFALATGVVNACVTEPQVQHALLADAHEHHHAGTSTRDVGNDAAPQPQPQRTLAADKAPCIKFCGEKASGVSGTTPGFDLWPMAWLAIPTMPGQRPMAAERGTLRQRADAPAPSGRVPLTIALLRLTR